MMVTGLPRRFSRRNLGRCLDAAVLKQYHHVFHHPGGGDDAPFGKIGNSAPKYDVGLDENLGVPMQMVEAIAARHRPAYGFLWGFIGHNGDNRLGHATLLWVRIQRVNAISLPNQHHF
jgi:hypothetical protein